MDLFYIEKIYYFIDLYLFTAEFFVYTIECVRTFKWKNFHF